jgi:hypothetical protein
LFVNKNNFFSFILVLIPLGLLATFRYPGLTPDTLSYYNLTPKILYENSTIVEPFHKYLTLFFGIFPISNYFLTSLTFLTYYVLFIAALKQAFKALPMQNTILFATLLQVFVYLNLVQMRWGLACVILIYACQLEKRLKIKRILTVLFAASIHYFAILFIFLPFIKVKGGKIWMLFFLPILLLLFSASVVIDWITDLMKFVGNYGVPSISHVSLKLEYYFKRISVRDNMFNIFNLFNFASYMMIIILRAKNIYLESIKNLIVPFLVLLSLYVFFLDIPIFSRRIMLLQTIFAVPIFFVCCLKFRPSLFVYFIGITLCTVSFVNISFIKGMLRI